jgi:DNA polymerase IV
VAWLLHVDMDHFITAVEVLRRPELRGRPVVVGGDGNPARPRQVVAGASYEARAFGVRSGMPLSAAARKCADAVFLPADRAAYDRASATVMEILKSFPVDVEVWGWDEAYVGGEIADPHALAADMRAAVLARSGLSCTVGIGHNKHQAKIAAQFGKPGGIFEITSRNWAELMAARPVAALHGVGPKTAKRLDALGLRTVGQLAAADPDALLPVFGPRLAPWLPFLARGGGETTIVTEPWIARSRGHEVTFEADVADPAEVAARLSGLARDLCREVVAEGRRITHVAVKVRYRSFFTPIRSMKLRGGPTTDPAVVDAAALTVLGKIDLDRPIRLLGVRVDLEMP